MHYLAACFPATDAAHRAGIDTRIDRAAARVSACPVRTQGFTFLAWGGAAAAVVEQYPLISSAPDAGPVDVFSDGALESIVPPYACGAFDSDRQQFRAMTDALGLGRVYVGRADGVVVVGSKAAAVAEVLACPLDVEAIALFATMGWYGGRSTPWRGVEVLGPGTRITVDGTDGAAPRVTFHHAALSDLRPSTPAGSLKDAADRMVAVCESIARRAPGPLRIGLSGGRDSRLVAAALMAAGADVEFFTIARFEEEVDVARTVAARLAPTVKHSITDPVAPESRAHDFMESARAMASAYDGMFEPAYIGSKMPAPGATRRLSVSGNAGELAHGHYYPKPDAASGLTDVTSEQAMDHLFRRVAWLKCGSTQGEAGVRALIANVGSEAMSLGWSGVRTLDWFYLRERLRRWAGISQAADRITSPLTSQGFVRQAFASSIDDITDSRLHKRLIAVLAPSLADVGFFKANGKGAPIRIAPLNVAAEHEAEIRDNAAVRSTMVQSVLDTALADCGAGGGGTPRSQAIVKRAAAIAALSSYA